MRNTIGIPNVLTKQNLRRKTLEIFINFENNIFDGFLHMAFEPQTHYLKDNVLLGLIADKVRLIKG